jgi:hypothetical protein
MTVRKIYELSHPAAVAEIERLQAERDEWKQAAGVEAGLRREFLAEIERLRAALTVVQLFIRDELIAHAITSGGRSLGQVVDAALEQGDDK